MIGHSSYPQTLATFQANFSTLMVNSGIMPVPTGVTPTGQAVYGDIDEAMTPLPTFFAMDCGTSAGTKRLHAAIVPHGSAPVDSAQADLLRPYLRLIVEPLETAFRIREAKDDDEVIAGAEEFKSRAREGNIKTLHGCFDRIAYSILAGALYASLGTYPRTNEALKLMDAAGKSFSAPLLSTFRAILRELMANIAENYAGRNPGRASASRLERKASEWRSAASKDWLSMEVITPGDAAVEGAASDTADSRRWLGVGRSLWNAWRARDFKALTHSYGHIYTGLTPPITDIRIFKAYEAFHGSSDMNFMPSVLKGLSAEEKVRVQYTRMVQYREPGSDAFLEAGMRRAWATLQKDRLGLEDWRNIEGALEFLHHAWRERGERPEEDMGLAGGLLMASSQVINSMRYR